jgi:hypothetical protein
MAWDSERFRKGITNAVVVEDQFVVCSGKELYSMDIATGAEKFVVPVAKGGVGNADQIMTYKDMVVVGDKGVSTFNMKTGEAVASGKYKKSDLEDVEGDRMILKTEWRRHRLLRPGQLHLQAIQGAQRRHHQHEHRRQLRLRVREEDRHQGGYPVEGSPFSGGKRGPCRKVRPTLLRAALDRRADHLLDEDVLVGTIAFHRRAHAQCADHIHHPRVTAGLYCFEVGFL